ncbi:hypothetical protein GINT2_001913 [Glugoides intestinalis]
MNLLSFLILSSLTLASRVRGRRHNNSCMPCDIDSSWSSSSSEEEKCRSRNPRYREQYNGLCRKCLSAFNQVVFMLNSADVSDTSVIIESFKTTNQKLDASLSDATGTLLSQFEGIETELSKAVVLCTEKDITLAVSSFTENVRQNLTDHLAFNKDYVDMAMRDVLILIAGLAAFSDPDIVLAITTPGSPFYLLVDAAIARIHDYDKQDILRIRSNVRKEILPTTLLGRQNLTACIGLAFKKARQETFAIFKTFNASLKKQFGNVLKAAEGSLLTSLMQLNKRLADGVRYILNACSDAILGGGYENCRIALPLLIPETLPTTQ